MADKQTNSKKDTKPIKNETSKKLTEKTTVKKPSVKNTATIAKKTPSKKSEVKYPTRVAEAYHGDDHKFEIFCETYLHRHKDKYGEPESRNKTKDGGVDIISIKKDEYGSIEQVFYVSVKNEVAHKIGTPILDSITGAMKKFTDKYGDSYTKHIPMVMASGEFSPDAIKLSKKTHVILIDGHKLSKEKRID